MTDLLWLIVAVLVVGWLLGFGFGRRGQRSEVEPPAPGELPEVEALVADGKTFEAVKAYRARTHVGLAEAKSAVDAIALRSQR